MRTYEHAGEIIKIEMVRCGYTLDLLSEKTAVSPAVLRGILTGRSKAISTRCICALSSAFGYSAAEFIDLLSENTRS
jgi:plasmid maintenance system antidote protein VapI